MGDDVVGELGTLTKCSAFHLAFEVVGDCFVTDCAGDGESGHPVFNHDRDYLARVDSVKDNDAGRACAVVVPFPVAIVIADHPDLIEPWAEPCDN